MFEQGGHSQPLSLWLSLRGPTGRTYLQFDLSRLGFTPGSSLLRHIYFSQRLEIYFGPPTQKVILICFNAGLVLLTDAKQVLAL